MWKARLAAVGLLAASGLAQACPENLDFSFVPLTGGEPQRLCDTHAGKLILVVNTASKCAFTPQYEGLERLYETYRERGLVVLGFPSNDFGGQEPGTAAEIVRFCRLTYGVRFPMYEKVRAAEGPAHPFFRRLAQSAGEYPRWNFHKYLIDRQGRVIQSWRSAVEPLSPTIVEAIEKAL